MTLARNHQQPLNGNKGETILILVLVVQCFSCASTKPAKTEVHKPSEKKVVVVDPPNQTSQPDSTKDSKPVIREVPDSTSTKINDKKNHPVIELEKPHEKVDSFLIRTINPEQISIMMLLPVERNASDSSFAESVRFFQFYCGAQLALEDYKKTNGMDVLLSVHEENGKEGVEKTLGALQTRKPDCIIGPYNIDALKLAAEWAKQNKTLVISPWISSSTIAVDNPYYLQIKAGLNKQFKFVHQHIQHHFSGKKIYIVGKSTDDPKVNLFLREAATHYEEVVFKEEELASSSDLLFEDYLSKDNQTVFILPHYSAKDENFVYHFLRRLSAEKLDRAVVVYGSQRWLDFKEEVVDYINKLNVRMCLGNIMDVNPVEQNKFKLRYYETYREFPRNDAFEGYDLMQFVLYTSNLKSHQVNHLSEAPKFYQTQFKIEPVSKDSLRSRLDYFENAYLQIAEMQQYKLVVVE